MRLLLYYSNLMRIIYNGDNDTEKLEKYVYMHCNNGNL